MGRFVEDGDRRPALLSPDSLDLLPGLVWTALADGRVDFVNKGWLDYTGLSIEDALGHGWRSTVHPEDRPALLAGWQSFVESAAACDLTARLRRHDGENRWFLFRATPVTESSGEVLKWYGVSTDIDALKRSESFLAESERLSQTGSLFWRLDPEEIIASEEMRRILGLPEGEVTLERIASRFHPDDMHIFVEQVDSARQGREVSLETRLLMPDGSVKYIRAIGVLIPNKDGSPEYFAAAQDVSALRLSEQGLAKARSELAHMTRVSSLSALAASIAHEVNQPITAALANANACLRFLSRAPPDLKEAREAVQAIVDAETRAAEIVSRTREFFKTGAPQKALVDVDDVVRGTVVLLQSEARRHSVPIRMSLAAGSIAVMGDRVQLQQVIMNLIMNGIDAMKDAEGARELAIRSLAKDDGRIEVSISDTGIGLPSQSADRIFDTFFTTKADGTGMGLSISRSIVEAHGGRLWAEPNARRGATFQFTLPVANET
jgi:PAS domain S-box-containing protein